MRTSNFLIAKLLCGVVLALVASAASAQKSKDTLRVAFRAPISTIDVNIDPQPETVLSSSAAFDFLILFDPESEEGFRPSLAQSWKQVDPLTLEFKLQEGVKFHDGSELTADDVVYTFNYITDPASKLRFAMNFEWLAQTVKIDKYTVRMIAKRPTPYALARLATGGAIFPAAVHGKLADKTEFGRKNPIGTGPYKVEYVDSSRGISLVRNDLFKSPGPWRPAGSVSRIHILPMPDLQTQIAQLMTGGIELILDASKDEADQLAKTPNLALTPVKNVNFHYMAIDATNRSGNAALLNPDVRKALMMAVDRNALIKSVIAGGDSVRPIDAMCAPTQVGCAVSVPPPSFDPNAAKALLAKAGLATGLEVEITSIPGSEKTSEAIAGQFRAIGVQAKVDHKTFVTFREKQGSGKIQVLVANWSSGGTPDVVATAEYFFGAPPRDYWNDEQVKTLAARAAAEMDVKARTALYRDMFNRMNSQYYFMSISTMPAILIHTKDALIPPISRVFTGVELEKVRWR